jgi:cytochrome b subunit of formate dehydrogenase
MSTPAKKTHSARHTKPTISISWRDAVDAVTRMRTDHKGARYINRFSTAVAIEHFVFMLAIMVLGLTGFAQTFYSSQLGSGILVLLGGIDSVRQVHHAFAFILGFSTVYHVVNYLNEVVVYRRFGGMWFDKNDWSLLFRLGASPKPVRFGRYTFAEKVSYWVIGACILILGVTGLVQGFPIWAAKIMPGAVIPAARLFHRWEAVLCVVAVLVWHLYDVVFRKFNLSIFTGNMSLKNMEEDHPLELQFLEQAASVIDSKAWPVVIELPQEEPVAASPVETPKTVEPVEGPKDAATESPVETPAKEEK